MYPRFNARVAFPYGNMNEGGALLKLHTRSVGHNRELPILLGGVKKNEKESIASRSKANTND